ncbi:MAG: endopeptidase La [Lachnospiraceae bacterium]|nr:endopeptidase La [Lachnospiraceae bacterium]
MENKNNRDDIEMDRGIYIEALQLLGCEELPTVALRGLTIIPGMVIHFDISRDKSVESVEQAMLADQRLLVVTQKDPEEEDPDFDGVYEIGTVTVIKQVSKLPNHVVRVLVEGVARARLFDFVKEDGCLVTRISYEKDDMSDINASEEEAMTRTVKEILAQYCACFPKVGKAIEDQIEDAMSLGELLDCITINMPLSVQRKQRILSAVSVRERFETLSEILAQEIEVVRIKNELARDIKQKIDQNQREYILREQLHYIKEELGENNTDSDVEQFEAAVEKLKAKKEVKEKIRKEIARYRNVAGSSSESAVERAYIETLLELPWEKASKDSNDLQKAEDILNAEHYGLDKVKERMLEYLAVRALTGKGSSPIICLVGPPGTGKTSIARSVAEALHKKYVRICLGGVRDEAEIRGHRKTYVGAMPGRITNAIRQAGVKNPLLLLDEIDKVSGDYKGDPASALLEVLDGEQNGAFCDHYVEIPIDLSEVLFIATANSTDGIPRPLLDRMELIEVNSYTANEKFHIAKEHLVEKQLKKNGIKPEELEFTDDALRDMISFYTREAGVRGLERQIGAVCRKEARRILLRRQSQTAGGPECDTPAENPDLTNTVKVTADNLTEYLGKHKYSNEHINKKDEVGIVRGLAWTSVGGDTLQIEVNMMPGEGDIDLTGQMGDVMKESARIAMSYVRSVSESYQVPEETYTKKDFHIHIPEGAVPKDGPSAGITMATAILSAVTGIPVRADLAMTGEVTLRGKVLPIGGLKEKLLAAKTAGVKTVLVPKENEKDVEEISEEIRDGMEIHYVEHMEEVAAYALVEAG